MDADLALVSHTPDVASPQQNSRFSPSRASIYVGGVNSFTWLLWTVNTATAIATIQRYRKRYPTPEDMGKLRFSELEVQPLGQTTALVLGRWHLTLSGEDLEGSFSLVFRLIGSRWQIIHDRTSLLREEK